MEDKSYTFSDWEQKYIRDMINFLRNNNIPIFKRETGYRTAKEIIAEVRAKFENS